MILLVLALPLLTIEFVVLSPLVVVAITCVSISKHISRSSIRDARKILCYFALAAVSALVVYEYLTAYNSVVPETLHEFLPSNFLTQ